MSDRKRNRRSENNNNNNAQSSFSSSSPRSRPRSTSGNGSRITTSTSSASRQQHQHRRRAPTFEEEFEYELSHFPSMRSLPPIDNNRDNYSHPHSIITGALTRHVNASTAVSSSRSTSEMNEDEKEEESSDDDFLLTGAEKKAKQERKARSAAAPTTGSLSSVTTAAASSSPSAPALEGYYFDVVQRKYFKILPPHIHSAAAAAASSSASSSFDRSVHSILGARRRKEGKENGGERKKQKMKDSNIAASSAPSHMHLPPPHRIHPSFSNNILYTLHTREYTLRSVAASSSLRRVLPSLLHPCRTFPVFTKSREFTSSISHPAGDYSLAYEPNSRILSIIGSREWIKEATNNDFPMEVKNTRRYAFMLEPIHPSSNASSPGLPFCMRYLSDFWEDSPITSLHLLEKWSIPPSAQRSSPSTHSRHLAHNQLTPLFSAAINTRLEMARQRLRENQQEPSMWDAIPDEAAISFEPLRQLTAYTTLGGEKSGSFTIRMDLNQSHEEPKEIFGFSFTRGSVFTSAIPKSLHEDTFDMHNMKVALGCTKGGIVLDLMTGQPTMRIESNRSDILTSMWCNANSMANSDDVVLMCGSRDGIIRMTDTRIAGKKGTKGIHNDSSRNSSVQCGDIMLESSVCWLHQLRTNPNHLLTAAVNGQIALFDLRRIASPSSVSSLSASTKHSSSSATMSSSSSSSSFTTPLLSYSGQVNSFSSIPPCVSHTEETIYCGGEDGRVRVWDLRSGRMRMEMTPKWGRSNAHFTPTTTASSLPPVRRVVYLDEFDTLLAGSELGVTAFSMYQRQKEEE